MDTARDELRIETLIKAYFAHLQLIILPAVAGALCLYILATSIVAPRYVSNIKISVYTRPDQQINPVGNIQADTLLVQDYAAVIKSRRVAERVIEELQLIQNGRPVDPGVLSGDVIVNPGDGTSRMIEVSIVSSDPFLAADIANQYGESSREVIKEMYSADNIQVVDEANIPLQKYSPNVMRFVILGTALGAITGCAVVTVLFMIENKIKL